MDKEYILCAAIVRLKPSTIKTGNYKTNSNECDDIYFIEIGRRHNDILARFGKKKLDVNRQGFYTSYGRFVDRRLAMEIASPTTMTPSTLQAQMKMHLSITDIGRIEL